MRRNESHRCPNHSRQATDKEFTSDMRHVVSLMSLHRRATKHRTNQLGDPCVASRASLDALDDSALGGGFGLSVCAGSDWVPQKYARPPLARS